MIATIDVIIPIPPTIMPGTKNMSNMNNAMPINSKIKIWSAFIRVKFNLFTYKNIIYYKKNSKDRELVLLMLHNKKGCHDYMTTLSMINKVWDYFSEDIPATRYSLFRRAIFSRDISLGHSASQAPVFVQAPKPSSSI